MPGDEVWMPDYLDFDMLVEPSEEPEEMTARVLASPAGEATHHFSKPFSDLELENFILRVGATRRGVRRIDSPEMDAAQRFGSTLYEAVFGGEVGTSFRRSLDEAERSGAGLRVRLRFAGAPELANIPWEYLFSPGLSRFLVLSVDTPLVRYLDLPGLVRPLEVQPPLRVLVMISSPTDYPALEVETEWDRLREALGDLTRRGVVELSRLETASLAALQQQLRRHQYHVFHFVGHGVFDDREQDGVLLLEDEQQRGRRVSGRYLGTLLHDHKSLRLTVLNSCEGARAARDDPFAGTAQSLVQQGIPAVIAMQFEITDRAAVRFAHEFYASLADGYPVDAGMAEARKAIFADGNDVEWGTPVLYLRSPDGRIFDITGPPPDDLIDQLFRRAVEAFEQRNHEQAIQLLEAVLAERPDHGQASELLERARRGREAAGKKEQADRAAAAGDWQAVVDLYEQIAELDPEFGDPDGVLAEARRQLEQERGRHEDERLAEAGRAVMAGRFAEAERLVGAILADRPDRTDALAVRSEVARLRDEVEPKLDEARRLVEQGAWQQALAILEEIVESEPGFHGGADLQQQAEQGLARDRRRTELLTQAEGLAAEGRWVEVAALLDQIEEIEGGPDLDDLRAGLEAAGFEAEAPSEPVQQEELPPPSRDRDEPPSPPEAPDRPPARVPLAAVPRWAWIGAVGVAVAILAVVLSRPGPGPDGTAPPTAPTTTAVPTVATTAPAPEVTVAVTLPAGADPVNHVVALRAAAPLTIDGDLSDWPAWPPELEARSIFPVFTDGWDGTEDMEAVWRLQWDEGSLFVAVEVPDDRHVQNQSGFNIFRGDSVDLRFDTDRDGDDDFDPNDFELQLSPGDFANLPPSAALFIGNGRGFANGNLAEEVKVEARPLATGGGYVLEAAVPWHVLGGRPEPGVLLGLGLQANDIDRVVDPPPQELMISNLEPPPGYDTDDPRFINEPSSFGTFHLDRADVCAVTGGC